MTYPGLPSASALTVPPDIPLRYLSTTHIVLKNPLCSPPVPSKEPKQRFRRPSNPQSHSFHLQFSDSSPALTIIARCAQATQNGTTLQSPRASSTDSNLRSPLCPNLCPIASLGHPCLYATSTLYPIPIIAHRRDRDSILSDSCTCPTPLTPHEHALTLIPRHPPTSQHLPPY